MRNLVAEHSSYFHNFMRNTLAMCLKRIRFCSRIAWCDWFFVYNFMLFQRTIRRFRVKRTANVNSIKHGQTASRVVPSKSSVSSRCSNFNLNANSRTKEISLCYTCITPNRLNVRQISDFYKFLTWVTRSSPFNLYELVLWKGMPLDLQSPQHNDRESRYRSPWTCVE